MIERGYAGVESNLPVAMFTIGRFELCPALRFLKGPNVDIYHRTSRQFYGILCRSGADPQLGPLRGWLGIASPAEALLGPAGDVAVRSHNVTCRVTVTQNVSFAPPRQIIKRLVSGEHRSEHNARTLLAH